MVIGAAGQRAEAFYPQLYGRSQIKPKSACRFLTVGVLRGCTGKDRREAVVAVAESLTEIAADQKTVQQVATPRGVVHFIGDQRSTIARFELVTVMPEAVGATQLNINKPVRRGPVTNLGRPFHGNPMNLQAIFNHRAFSHGDRLC